MPTHNRIHYPLDKVRELVKAGRSQSQIASELQKTTDPRVTAKLVHKLCMKHGIEFPHGAGARPGSEHADWQGGRIVTKQGYVKLYCPEHPTCVAANERRAAKAGGKWYRKQNYVWEHWIVMEKVIRRHLHPKEVVHHVNGIRSDNRPQNLIVFQTNAYHLKKELKGRCPKWTEAGAARIQAGVEQWRASRRQRKALGAQAQP